MHPGLGPVSDGGRVLKQPDAHGVGLAKEDHPMAELSTDARKKLPKSKFAEPEKRKYPIEDKAHARNAKARASQAANAGRISKAEEERIDKKADAVLKQR
jgi:hypothetical protein